MLTRFKLVFDSHSHRGWGWWWLPTTRTRWGSPCSRCRRTTSSRRTRLATMSFEQIDGICPNRWSALDNFWACATTSPSHWVRPISLKDYIVSPPLFRPGGLQRVQVRSVRTRQRGAPLPFQVHQVVQGSFCLINHILPRRAHENKGILEKLEKEKSLLKRELRDRVGILLIVKGTMIIRSKQQKDDQQGKWKIEK